MRYLLFLFFKILIPIIVKAQSDTTSFNSFLIYFENNKMNVENGNQQIVYRKQFYNPYVYLGDINLNQYDELVVLDSVMLNGKLNFYIYLFDGKNDFRLIDSIFSGTYFPFISYAEEISSLIIQTGIPEFDLFNVNSVSHSLPVNIWKVEDDGVFLISDEVYEPFIFENENHIRLLDYYLTDKMMDCTEIQNYKGIIASAFVNYLSAGEYTLAEQFLKKYYPCEDRGEFKQKILGLFFPKAKY